MNLTFHSNWIVWPWAITLCVDVEFLRHSRRRLCRGFDIRFARACRVGKRLHDVVSANLRWAPAPGAGSRPPGGLALQS